MILELDCGNSFIKWRVLSGLDGVVASGVDESLGAALESIAGRGLILTACRLVSVRSDLETRELELQLAGQLRVPVLIARSAECLAGVSNGYTEPLRLGLDRWLALVAAFHMSQAACLVLDLGTAVTADFVSHEGHHLGGFICPGLALMKTRLKTHTRRIRYEQDEVIGVLREPGRNTADAVERGCMHMIRGFAEGQVLLARELLGENFQLFLTGGDAVYIADQFDQARLVPDLVFKGLALACPIGSGDN